MNKIIDILHSQPRTIITLLLALIIGGVYSYITIPKESNPDIDIPIFYAALQGFLVASLSIIFAYIFEDIVLSNIFLESTSIIYAGVLSGGVAFTLQMFAQKNIEEAPAAIIYSLEGVFAVVAAWIILDQVLNINNVIGCVLILVAVIFSQLAPEINKN